MKIVTRGFIFSAFAVTAGMVILASNAQCADDAMPKEVRALIGMKLPPKVMGRKQEEIPSFIQASGVLRGDLVFDEGFVNGKWPVFIVRRVYSDMSVKILDALMLPENLIEWKLVDGKRKFLEGRYQLSDSCQAGTGDFRLIFGLVKPEKGKSDVSHDSNRVKKAWLIDENSGHITSIPTQNLKCYYFTGDD